MIKPLGNHNVHALNQYVIDTTVADTPSNVFAYLLYYLTTNTCSLTVQSFIYGILKDEELMNKTVIVNDHRLYETLINIYPKQVSAKDRLTPNEALDLYRQEAEILFLRIVTEKTQLAGDDCVKARNINNAVYESIMGTSPYAKSKRENALEKEMWKNRFMNHKKSILNDMLDIYNTHKFLHEHINEDKEFNSETYFKWMKLIAEKEYE